MKPLPLLLAGFALCACSSESEPVAESASSADVWFIEEAAARGIDFTHRSGAAGDYAMPEIMCGGAALVDVLVGARLRLGDETLLQLLTDRVRAHDVELHEDISLRLVDPVEDALERGISINE